MKFAAQCGPNADWFLSITKNSPVNDANQYLNSLKKTVASMQL